MTTRENFNIYNEGVYYSFESDDDVRRMIDEVKTNARLADTIRRFSPWNNTEKGLKNYRKVLDATPRQAAPAYDQTAAYSKMMSESRGSMGEDWFDER